MGVERSVMTPNPSCGPESSKEAQGDGGGHVNKKERDLFSKIEYTYPGVNDGQQVTGRNGYTLPVILSTLAQSTIRE